MGLLNGGVGASDEVMEVIIDDAPEVDDEAAQQGPIIVKKPCMSRELQEVINKEKREDDAAGINSPDYTCDLCNLGNDGLTEGSSLILSRVGSIDARLYTHVEDDVIFSIIAKEYNETVWAMNDRLERMNLRKWTKAGVRRHLTKHVQSNPRRMIWNVIRGLLRDIQHIEERGLYEKDHLKGAGENGGDIESDEPETINPKYMKMKMSLLKSVSEFSKLDLQYLQAIGKTTKQGGEANDQTPGKTSKSSKMANPYE